MVICVESLLKRMGCYGGDVLELANDMVVRKVDAQAAVCSRVQKLGPDVNFPGT